jgi:hypothetical protein
MQSIACEVFGNSLFSGKECRPGALIIQGDMGKIEVSI